MTTRYKEGSRVQACWELYQKSGADACLGGAVSLNLALGTIRGLLRAWEREDGKTPAPKERSSGRPNGEPKPVKMYTKQLVKVKYVKTKGENLAYLIEQGPQQSVVRFQHNGFEQCIPNGDLGLPIIRGEMSAVRRD